MRYDFSSNNILRKNKSYRWVFKEKSNQMYPVMGEKQMVDGHGRACVYDGRSIYCRKHDMLQLLVHLITLHAHTIYV